MDETKENLKKAVKELCQEIEVSGNKKLIEKARDVQDIYAVELEQSL